MRKLILSLAFLTVCLAPTPLWAEVSLEVTSPAFKHEKFIPQKYTCQGKDSSPKISWKGAPKNTLTFTVIMEDPDAQHGTWDHWVLYNLPPVIHSLPEGLPRREKLANGERQGLNSFQKFGYHGPCPPEGKSHRYYFKVYALDAALPLQGKVSKADVLKAMEGHILAEGELMGYYERRK